MVTTPKTAPVKALLLPVLLLLAPLAPAGCASSNLLPDPGKGSADARDALGGAIADLDAPGQVEAARDAKGDDASNPRLRGALACGTTATGTFAADATYHLYTLDGRAGERLTLSAAATDGVSDLVLALFRVGRRGALAVNDDCHSGTLDSCLDDQPLTEDGEYVVLVTTSWGAPRGDYQLSLECYGLGRIGDPCAGTVDCGDGLGCGLAPGDSSGQCTSAECGGTLDETCVNAECVAFDGSSDGAGFCHRPTFCDDGSVPACRRMIPICEPGTILAYRNSCYQCVDPGTCAPPAPALECAPRGCSGQVCGDEPVMTTCDFREEYRCLGQALCGDVGDGCGWQIEAGSGAHECLLAAGRCVFDADCAAGEVCTATPGAGYGHCEGTGPAACERRGCWSEYCGFEPPRGVLCPAFSPAWTTCLGDAACTDAGPGCAWQIEPGDATHACLTAQGVCVFDGDCGTGESCVVNAGMPVGSCQSNGGTGRGEDELCSADLPCAEGLGCVGVPGDGSDDHGVCHDTAAQPHEGDTCALDMPCNPGLVCAGLSAGTDGFCAPAWMHETFASTEPLAIPDNDPDGVTSSVVARGLATVPTDVVLHLTIRHTWRGDLRVTLTDPNGQEVVVWDRQGGSADDLVLHTAVNGFSMDDAVNGRWTLRVADEAALDTGIVESWSLELTSRWD